jgi:prephenate dehydratase
LLLGRNGIPAPTGNDKSSVVVFQQANQPGSLLAILHEFAARNIDITRLESRPTRRELGDYCFLLDFEGHISDEVVADCLRELKMKQGNVKFLGSYPAYGSAGSQTVRDANANWSQAQEWIESLRNQME